MRSSAATVLKFARPLTVAACTARLEPREMRLAPLANKRLLRDLATEIAAPDERL